jgi:hypothetical protein
MKRCAVCGGNGFTTRVCRQCGGRGYTYGYSYAPQSSSPSVVLAPNGALIRIPPPPIWGGGSYVQYQCSLCGGSGSEKQSCQACAGRGWVSCPKTVRCPACDGKGTLQVKCQACEGRGRLQCPDCKGKGFSGEPLKDAPAPVPALERKGPGQAKPTQSQQLLSPL